MATQKLIWETSKNLKVEYYTKVNGGGTHIDISNEVNEILRLVDSHYTKPSFDGTTINATYRATITNSLIHFHVFLLFSIFSNFSTLSSSV